VNDFLICKKQSEASDVITFYSALSPGSLFFLVSVPNMMAFTGSVFFLVYRFSFSISNIVIATAIYNIYSSSILSKAIIK